MSESGESVAVCVEGAAAGLKLHQRGSLLYCRCRFGSATGGPSGGGRRSFATSGAAWTRWAWVWAWAWLTVPPLPQPPDCPFSPASTPCTRPSRSPLAPWQTPTGKQPPQLPCIIMYLPCLIMYSTTLYYSTLPCLTLPPFSIFLSLFVFSSNLL